MADEAMPNDGSRQEGNEQQGVESKEGQPGEESSAFLAFPFPTRQLQAPMPLFGKVKASVTYLG